MPTEADIGKRRVVEVKKIPISEVKSVNLMVRTRVGSSAEISAPSRACIFCPLRQTTLFREGPDDNGPVHLAHFTLPTGKEFWTTLPLLFFSELIGSAFINFPHFFIDSRLKHCAISEGLAVAGLVYAAVWVTYPLSGAHLNPMITLAFSITRNVPFYYLPIYWAGQFSGALLALSAGYFTSPLTKSINNTGMSIPHPKLSDGNAMLTESLFTFLLIIVVCSGTDEMRDFLWTTGDGSTLACAYMLIYLVSITLLEHIGSTDGPRSRNSSLLHFVKFDDCGQATEDLLSNKKSVEEQDMTGTLEDNLNNILPGPAEVEHYAEVVVNSEEEDDDDDEIANYDDDFCSMLLIIMLWPTVLVESTMILWGILFSTFL
ncbi:hypothetical protein Aperf_G00000102492 [Anoplocephala perfoliata]